MASIISDLFPSLSHGTKYHKCKEKFTNNDNNGLTNQTKAIIWENDYSSQPQQQLAINTLRTQYDDTLQKYKDVSKQISQNITNSLDRTSQSNPYLNKVIQFVSGQLCYVTAKGIAKYIASKEIMQSILSPTALTIVAINIPWQSTYAVPGSQIPTTPPLLAGTPITFGQSVGNEGSNIFVAELLSDEVTPTYMGCYTSASANISYIGDIPRHINAVFIQNGDFSQPELRSNTHKYITGEVTVPGWYFNEACLLNNSKKWAFPIPYPAGNQCAVIQNASYIYTTIALINGATYTISFSGCSRNCCNNQNQGNPIKVQLYTDSNAYISLIATCLPPVNAWTDYIYTFTVPTSQIYRLYFSGTNALGDQSSAIQNIVLSTVSQQNADGKYSYSDCQQSAIVNGFRYFGLQNVNPETNTGYCAVSNQPPSGTSSFGSECIQLNDATMGGGPNTVASYDVGSTSVISNMGKLAYVDGDSNLYTYAADNQTFDTSYSLLPNAIIAGNDIMGAAFKNATVSACETACNNNAQCAGFVTSSDGTQCWPKTQGIYPFKPSASENTNVYIRTKQPLNAAANNMNAHANTDTITYQHYINKGDVANIKEPPLIQLPSQLQSTLLQSTLNTLSTQIATLTSRFESGAKQASQQSMQNARGLQSYTSDIRHLVRKTTDAYNNSNNYENIVQDSDIVVLQQNYNYLIWSMMAMGTVLIAINVQ